MTETPWKTSELREWIKSIGFPIVVALILLGAFLWERREAQVALVKQLERIEAEQKRTTEAVRELSRRIR